MTDDANKSKSSYNDYRVECAPQKRSGAYSLCLQIIDAYDRGVIKDSFKECQTCLEKNTCAARVMRAQEIEQNEALYYLESPLKALHEGPMKIETTRKSNVGSDSYKRGFSMQANSQVAVKKSPKVKSKAPVKRAAESAATIESNPYALLIKAVAAKEQKSEAVEVEAEVPPERETMKQFIKRIKGEANAI